MSPKVTDIYKEQKRLEILEAAKKVFIRHGFRGVTMKDIVDESGLSRGGVYLYFSSTDEVFRSLLENSDKSYFALIKQLCKESKTAWKGIVSLINTVMMQTCSIDKGIAPSIYEYFLVIKNNGQAKNLLLRRFQRSLDSLNILIRNGIESKEFHPRFDPGDISRFLLFFMDGAAINTIGLGIEKVNLESQANQLILYLQHALGAVIPTSYNQ